MARQSYYSGEKLPMEYVARLLHQVGFQGDDIWRMLAIAGRESKYDPGAHGTDQPRRSLSGDRGLWQINSVHDDALRQAGIINNPGDLFNPLKNAEAAHWLYQQNNNSLSAWNAGPGGFHGGGDPLYGTNQTAARSVYYGLRDNGWGGTIRGGAGGPDTLGDIAQGLGNLGAPDYRQYATDPRNQINARYQAIMAANGGAGGGDPQLNFFNWQQHPELNDQYNTVSPHLKAFERWTMGNFGGVTAGDYSDRPVQGGSAPSSHAFGAAWDWSPDSRADADKMIELVTKNPDAFGIQAIHDYKNSRVWRLDREGDQGGGWESQAPGSHGGQMGSSQHLHFETNPDVWNQTGRRNWKSMNQAKRGTYQEGGATLTAEQFGQIAERMGNRGNPLFEDYATINARQLARRQTRYVANTPGQPGGTDGPPSQALTKLLEGIGIDYPNAPTPTPALLAYLAGVGLDLSTAEDLQRTALQRIRVNSRDTRQDINRAAGRAKESITGDLSSRGVLSSGEANKRFVRHGQDVAEAQSDLATQTGQLREDAQTGYNQAVDSYRRSALQSLADLDTQQQVEQAANRAQARGARQASRVSEQQYERERSASEDANQRYLDFINSLYRPTPTYRPPASPPNYRDGRY